jgi:hypothetical protein
VLDAGNHSLSTPEWWRDDPHLGEDGAWYFERCSDGTFNVVWLAAGSAEGVGNSPLPVVTARELAVQAAGYLPLPEPTVRHNPGHAGSRPQTVVGVPTWLWVEAASYRAMSQTTSAASGAGTVSATVTATPVGTEWRSGSPDAADATCAGPGVPYDSTLPEAAQSTYCSTIYRRSSAVQPQAGPSPEDRFFSGSATTVWRITWAGTDGTSGSLPDMRRSTTFPLAVAELQAVNR